jgi:hypothetical protein
MHTSFTGLQKQLLREVGVLLGSRSFKPKPSGQTFYSKQPYGWAAFHLSFIPHRPIDFDITADVALRFDAVEDLVNANYSHPLVRRSELKRTATIGAELGNISVGRPLRWTVSSEEDLGRVVPQIVAAFDEIGWPYIAAFSKMENVLSVLAKDDGSSHLHSPFHLSRWLSVIALAWLLKRYDELDDLIARGSSSLKERNEPFRERFEKLAAKLRSLPRGNDGSPIT